MYAQKGLYMVFNKILQFFAFTNHTWLTGMGTLGIDRDITVHINCRFTDSFNKVKFNLNPDKPVRCNLEDAYQKSSEEKETMKGCSVSGRFRKQRQDYYQSKLLEEFEECIGKEVEQAMILNFLGLDDDKKSVATRAITSIFPSCTIKRVMRAGSSLYPFSALQY